MAERLTYQLLSGSENEKYDSKWCRETLLHRLGMLENILYNPDGTERISLERLAELVEADKEGRAVVLPLKFEQDIYREGSSYSWQVCCYHVFPDEVVAFDDSDNAFTAKDIGVTVFLEPEAQAALDKMNGGK